MMRFFALALLASVLAVSACGKRGDPIRPAPRGGQPAEPLPTPPIAPQPDITITPEAEETF